MDGRLPISKAKSSHYCERKWETLSHYLNTRLAVWQCSQAGAILRPSLSPQIPWEGALELGTFGLFSRSFWAHILLCPDVYLLPPETELLLPISSASCHPSFGFPCLLAAVPSSFCVPRWFPQAAFWPAPHTTALCSQSLATSLLHIQPALPSKTAAPNSPTKCLAQATPLPSRSSMLFTAHCWPEHQLRWKERVGKGSSSHGLSGDTGVTQRVRAIHMVLKQNKRKK